MRLCELYKCKRMALGMTQAEFGEIVGVSSGTISKFESGAEISDVSFNAIRLGVEEYIRRLSREEYMELRLIENALSLKYQDDQHKMLTMNHMAIHIGKLNMELLKKNM